MFVVNTHYYKINSIPSKSPEALKLYAKAVYDQLFWTIENYGKGVPAFIHRFSAAVNNLNGINVPKWK